MKYNTISILNVTLTLLFAGQAWSVTPDPNPHRSATPPLGHSGTHVDDHGDTVMSYGNHPTHGIPQHAYHTESNQAHHPANAGAFPVNTASQQANRGLRNYLIGNKQGIPNHSKDHKPPNVQAMPGLTPQQRKDRTTVKNLPTSESNQEMRLAGQAHASARRPGTSGNIRLSPHLDPNIPRPASVASTLHSVPGGPSRLPRPVNQGSRTPAGTPRLTRAGTQFAGAHRPGTPAPSTPMRPAAAPGTPASRIPRPIARPPPVQNTPPSRIPRPVQRPPVGGLSLPMRPATPATPHTPTPAPRNRPSGSSGLGAGGRLGRRLRKRSDDFTLDELVDVLHRRSEAERMDELVSALQRRFLSGLDGEYMENLSVLAY